MEKSVKGTSRMKRKIVSTTKILATGPSDKIAAWLGESGLVPA